MALPLLCNTSERRAADPPQTAAPGAMRLGLMFVWAVVVIELGLGDSRWDVSLPWGTVIDTEPD